MWWRGRPYLKKQRETVRETLNLHSAPWSMFPVWQMTSHHHPGGSNQPQGQILKSEQTIATRWHQTAAGTWPHQNVLFHLGCWHFSTPSIKQHVFYMLTCIVHCTLTSNPSGVILLFSNMYLGPVLTNIAWALQTSLDYYNPLRIRLHFACDMFSWFSVGTDKYFADKTHSSLSPPDSS